VYAEVGGRRGVEVIEKGERETGKERRKEVKSR
jgi:hypothetical protein